MNPNTEAKKAEIRARATKLSNRANDILDSIDEYTPRQIEANRISTARKLKTEANRLDAIAAR